MSVVFAALLLLLLLISSVCCCGDNVDDWVLRMAVAWWLLFRSFVCLFRKLYSRAAESLSTNFETTSRLKCRINCLFINL